MKKKGRFVGAAAIALFALAGPATAHVTVQPSEALAESFSAFVVRVPNERDNASTTKVQVQLPPLAFVSFQDVPGWERQVKNGKFDEPIEAFGEELTEGVVSVTWTGGEVQPGEFTEFPFSAAMPAGENELEFPAIQTYDNGEVVRWTGPADAESPAAHLSTVELGDFAGEEAGQLGALHEVVHEVEELRTEVGQLAAASEDEPTTPAPSPADDDDAEDDDEESSTGVLLGGIGIGLGALALLVALFRGRSKT
jgi:uncharacterized protein YcnI